jgi:hypothetical protein
MLKHIIAAAILAASGLAASEAHAGSFETHLDGSLCVDIKGGRIVEGTPIQLWLCHGKAPQDFLMDTARADIIFAGAKTDLCVDGRDRQPLRLVRCGAVHTEWRYDANTKTVRSKNGLCWDVLGAKIQQQQPLVAWRCHNGMNQQFIYKK